MGRLNEHDPALISTAQRWVVRLTSGNMSEREMRRFREWSADRENDRAFQREIANWRKLGELRPSLAGSITLPPRAEVLRRRLARWVRRATAVSAVAFVAVLSGPKLILQAQADHIAGAALQRIELADGSHVVLDAGAAIAVNFTADHRRVELLRGRAWFDVAHRRGAVFEVAAADGMVQDIGTAFEVARDGDHVEASVSQGRVRVISAAHTGFDLVAGERARFTGDLSWQKERNVPAQRVADWRTGNIVLGRATVGQVIAEVARYRSAPTWVWGSLRASPRITVVLSSDRPDAALAALAVSAQLSLLRLPGGAIIIRQNPA
jgi:transmembrane sensor